MRVTVLISFLVQILKSFLFYTRLVSSNRLVEERAGHLYAVCLVWCESPQPRKAYSTSEAAV